MAVELINTGSELLLGRVLNTNQQWLGRQLSDLGYIVSRHTAVSDSAEQIASCVAEALSRSSVVIVTGGLGPTSDDLTRDAIAQLLGRKLVENPEIVASIEGFFLSRGRPMPERVRVQALVPEGALILPNASGTAPGLAIEVREGTENRTEAKWLVLLPGPPRELRPMFTNHAAPLLKREAPPSSAFVCRTLRTSGLGESLVESRIEGPLRELISTGLEVGYCARPGEVDVRLSSRGSMAESIVNQAEAIVRLAMKPDAVCRGDEPLEEVIVRMLTERKMTLALAESCTGGCLAHRLTNVPGASAVFIAGWVTYSNEAKQSFLGVRPQSLAEHGAVSEAVALEMAEGALRVSGADYALSVTGIAGPSGGSLDKPVGTVFIALASRHKTQVHRKTNCWDRVTFKEVTAQQAFNLLRLSLEQP